MAKLQRIATIVYTAHQIGSCRLHVLFVLSQALLLFLDSILALSISKFLSEPSEKESQGETGQNTRKFSRRTEMFWSMITSNVKEHICTHLRSMEFHNVPYIQCRIMLHDMFFQYGTLSEATSSSEQCRTELSSKRYHLIMRHKVRPLDWKVGTLSCFHYIWRAQKNFLSNVKYLGNMYFILLLYIKWSQPKSVQTLKKKGKQNRWPGSPSMEDLEKAT